MEHKIRIYVAASSGELDRAGMWMTKLADTGRFDVVSDWVDEIRAHGYNPNAGTGSERYDRAENCRAGVENSDLIWVLMPKQASMGAFWEFGYATACQLAVCISGCNQEASSFTEFAKYRFETDEQAFSFILDTSMSQLYGDVT